MGGGLYITLPHTSSCSPYGVLGVLKDSLWSPCGVCGVLKDSLHSPRSPYTVLTESLQTPSGLVYIINDKFERSVQGLHKECAGTL